MPHLAFVNRSQLFAVATAISAVGLLVIPAPAQASPMLPLPLAPACNNYAFTGGFSLRRDDGWQDFFSATGRGAGTGRAVTVKDDNISKEKGTVAGGGIQGRNVDFVINWDNTGAAHYTGVVGDDALVHKGVVIFRSNAYSAYWDSINGPLGCADAPPPAPPPPPASAPQPAPPAAQTAAPRLGVVVNGQTTLAAGMSGTYTVNLSNSGDTGAPVELYVSFGGQLQQTGQVTPSGGFNCDVINNAGGTTAIHCTTQQLQSKATASIVVQGRGSAPGAGHLTVTINSSDPGAQFVQKSQGLNVSIT
jgi:hypothetical protein